MSIPILTKTVPVQCTGALHSNAARTLHVEAAAPADELCRRDKSEVRLDNGCQALYTFLLQPTIAKRPLA